MGAVGSGSTCQARVQRDPSVALTVVDGVTSVGNDVVVKVVLRDTGEVQFGSCELIREGQSRDGAVGEACVTLRLDCDLQTKSFRLTSWGIVISRDDKGRFGIRRPIALEAYSGGSDLTDRVLTDCLGEGVEGLLGVVGIMEETLLVEVVVGRDHVVVTEVLEAEWIDRRGDEDLATAHSEDRVVVLRDKISTCSREDHGVKSLWSESSRPQSDDGSETVSDGDDLVKGWHSIAQTSGTDEFADLRHLADLVPDLDDVDAVRMVRSTNTQAVIEDGG